MEILTWAQRKTIIQTQFVSVVSKVIQMIFSMNVFKNKKRWKNKKNVKKRALNKKHKKRFLIYETLRWYGHVLRKDDDDWVKKMYYFRG